MMTSIAGNVTSPHLEFIHITENRLIAALGLHDLDERCRRGDEEKWIYQLTAVDGKEIEFSKGFTDLHTR